MIGDWWCAALPMTNIRSEDEYEHNYLEYGHAYVYRLQYVQAICLRSTYSNPSMKAGYGSGVCSVTEEDEAINRRAFPRTANTAGNASAPIEQQV